MGKTKKILALLLAGLMAVTLVACDDEEDVVEEYEDFKDIDATIDQYRNGALDKEGKGEDVFTFTAHDSVSVIITGFHSNNNVPHTVTIPAYVNDGNGEKLVAGIAREAFALKSNISKLVFPTEADFAAVDPDYKENFKTFDIAELAFRQCVALADVELPSYLTSLGGYAFYGCTGLKEVVFAAGDELQEIGESCFGNCTALEKVVLPAGVGIIGKAAFFGCTALTEINVPAALKRVGESAFQGCTNLYLVFDEDVEVGDYAMAGTRTEPLPSEEETETEPEETGSEPEETGSEPEETGSKPEETGSEPEETGSEPEETGSEPVEEESSSEPEQEG